MKPRTMIVTVELHTDAKVLSLLEVLRTFLNHRAIGEIAARFSEHVDLVDARQVTANIVDATKKRGGS